VLANRAKRASCFQKAFWHGGKPWRRSALGRTRDEVAAMSAPSLSRHAFKTSRLAEFCSEKELINQTGHDSDDWLIDNALDACEEAGAAPVIHVEVSDAEIAVFDNGSGIAPETVAGILDYNTRTSIREAYVSPMRGAQGNALKTLLAMPFALDGERGETTIESQGVAHRITFSIDPIRQEPRLVRACEDSSVKSGTRVAVSWPISACSILDDAQANFLRIAEDYTWVNPHLTLTVKWDRDGCDPVQWAIPARRIITGVNWSPAIGSQVMRDNLRK
jgi:DNA topoisomerase VI subunit B